MLPSVGDFFAVDEQGSVRDAWLTATNLFDLAEQSQRIPPGVYDLADAREKASKILSASEAHKIDSKTDCGCGLTPAEHGLLKRKMLTFFRLQVDSLKHLVTF